MTSNTVPAPTPADLSRNLTADLAVVEAATAGPWMYKGCHTNGYWWCEAPCPECVESIVFRRVMTDAEMDAAARAAMDRASRDGGEAVCPVAEQSIATWRDTASSWSMDGGAAIDEDQTHLRPRDAHAIAESREGWPAAIRRALAAEAECERLRFGIAEAADRLLAWCDMPDADATMRAVSRYLRQLLKEGNTNG